ncbi:MAG: AraC family transcriptional regulator [Acutalibacter sp.]|jgi:AraC-like DNA-binding protein
MKAESAVAPSWWHSLVPLNYGYESCSPGHSFGPAVRHYHLLHYVLEGEGTFYQGGSTHSVEAGDLFVILPEELTTYCGSQEHPWTYVWLGFRAEETPDFLKEPVLRRPPVRKLFEQLRDLSLEVPQDGSQDGLVFSLLYELLWDLSRNGPPSQDRSNTYAAYAKTYLETSYMQPVSIQGIADALHIDRRYLTVLFRQAYGVPPQAYLMELRLEQARAFLVQGYGVAEAASMSGFSDLANFSRSYKRRFGMSPSGQKGISPHKI